MDHEASRDADAASAFAVGFTVLDGTAFVAGAAVSLVHVRGAIHADLIGPGWVLLGGTFFWIALTAAGPFLFLFRRFLRPQPGYPRVGDGLWALLGLPWLLTTVVQGEIGAGGQSSNQALVVGLSLGVTTAVLIASAVVWTTWVSVSPERAGRAFAGPWTNRMGLLLAIAWPFQCGVGMVIIG